MNITQAILFSTLIFSISSDLCDAPGECKEGIYLANEPAIDSFGCWKKCRSHQGCNFGTFIPNMNLCSLYETCTKMDNNSCPNCLTSSNKCAQPQCDIPGLCVVSMSNKFLIILFFK